MKTCIRILPVSLTWYAQHCLEKESCVPALWALLDQDRCPEVHGSVFEDMNGSTIKTEER